jgi:Secretion system C-terminal sorting domain
MKNILFYKLFILFIAIFLFSSVFLFSQETSYGDPAAEIPLTRLQLWLKSDAGIIANNGRVSEWLDQSGSGNDAVETDTSRQPVLIANELNGKPVISFDGVNDRLGFTGSKEMSQVSVFAVLKNKVPDVNSDAEGSVLTFGPGGTYNASEHLGLRMRGFPPGNDNDVVVGTGDGPDYVLATSMNLAKYNEWRNISFVTNEKLFNTTFRWNGNDASMAPSGSNLPMSISLGDSAAAGGGIGSTDNFGNLGYPITMAKCDFAEIIVYDTVLSDTDRLAVEKYLNDKYKITITGIDDSKSESIPAQFTLYQNYPNPFNPATNIRFQISKSGFVSLRVYDVLGKEVATLVNEYKPAGKYEIEFNASNLSSGVYYYRLTAGSNTSVKKMILLK